jgi:hypothetical protein
MIYAMAVTALHLLYVPLAMVCGHALGAAARRKSIASPWLALALALLPGLVISFALGRSEHPNEQGWQGFLVWAAWTGLGVWHGWRGPRQPKQLTTLNLSGREM